MEECVYYLTVLLEGKLFVKFIFKSILQFLINKMDAEYESENSDSSAHLHEHGNNENIHEKKIANWFRRKSAAV